MTVKAFVYCVASWAKSPSRRQRESNFTFLAGTFKRQKERLRKEGFDLASVTDPLFFMDANSESFVALDRDLQRRIDDGQVRLT